jgi:prepilin-type N-terminal cleavage/methylation domain-containing protein
MTTNRRGYTLIEMMISTALVGVLSAITIVSILSIQRTAGETRYRAEADQEIKMLADWLASSVRGVGGGAVSPWMALYVENNVSGNGADRVTWADLDPDYGPCSILSKDSDLLWSLGVANSLGTCCLDADADSHQALLVSAEGDIWRSVLIDTVAAGACSVTFSGTGGSVIGSTVPASGLLAANDEIPDEADVDSLFVGGTLHVVDIQRLSLDPNEAELVLEEDRDPVDGDFESRLMMDRIYDLQVALGYDSDPTDGRVSNDGTINDEWLGNSESDALGSGGLADAETVDLRMIQLGFTHGNPTDLESSNSVQVLDGPILYQVGVVLQAHTTRVALRNRVPFQ